MHRAHFDVRRAALAEELRGAEQAGDVARCTKVRAALAVSWDDIEEMLRAPPVTALTPEAEIARGKYVTAKRRAPREVDKVAGRINYDVMTQRTSGNAAQEAEKDAKVDERSRRDRLRRMVTARIQGITMEKAGRAVAVLSSLGVKDLGDEVTNWADFRAWLDREHPNVDADPEKISRREYACMKKAVYGFLHTRDAARAVPMSELRNWVAAGRVQIRPDMCDREVECEWREWMAWGTKVIRRMVDEDVMQESDAGMRMRRKPVGGGGKCVCGYCAAAAGE